MTTHRKTLRAATLLPALALSVVTACTPTAEPPAPPPPPPSIVSFSVSEAEVKSGTQVTLSWETKDATKVELRDVVQGLLSTPEGASGSTEVTVTDDALFVLVAQNERGVRDSAAVSVQVKGVANGVLFVGSPSRVSAGEPVELAWTARGATRVEITPEGGGPLDLEGQLETGAVTVHPTATTRYVLTVDGEETASVQVQIGPRIVALAATPEAATPGQPLTIGWQVTGASRVILSSATRGVLHTETDPSLVADGSFEETASAEVLHGGAHSYVLRAEGPAPDEFVEQPLVVYVAGTPRVVSFTAPPYVSEGSSFTVSWETANADWVEVRKDGVALYTSPDAATAKQGSTVLASPEPTAEYTLVALESRGGRAVSEPVVIEALGLPSVTSFTTSPAGTIANGGDPVTLSWDVPNARNLEIVAVDQYSVTKVTGTAAATGSVVTYPNKDTQYLLRADNGIGDTAVATTDVSVTAPITLVYSPSSPAPGSQVTITGHTGPAGASLEVGPVIPNLWGESFVDISATGTSLNYAGPDTTGKPVTLPAAFTTTINGVPFSGDKLCIGNNGWLAFGLTSCNGYEGPYNFPSDKLEPLAIAPLWTDLYDNVGVSEMYWQLDTVGSDQRVIVQWDKFEHDDAPDASVLTVQAQIYSSGKIVFAYASLTGLDGKPFAIGVVNGDETSGVFSGYRPQPGDTLTFFSNPGLPFSLIATPQPFKVRVHIPPDSFIEIETSFVPGAPSFGISEANVVPATGVIDGQWLEITNDTSSSVDLNGWNLDFGGGAVHTFTSPLIVPANGALVLAQSAAAGDGVAVDYVYGNTFAMAPGGSVKLGAGGYTVSTLPFPSAITAGITVHAIFQDKLVTVGPAVCETDASSTYGTNGQAGTPGAPNALCYPHALVGPLPGNFQSIATVGQKLVFANLDDGFVTVPLAQPVTYSKAQQSAMTVTVNGYLTFDPAFTCDTYCWSTNKTGLDPSTAPINVIAPFWDDLDTTFRGDIYVHQVSETSPGALDGYTIVSWENVHRFDDPNAILNFQVVFHDDGDVEYHYGSLSGSNGESATVWFEMPSGQAAFVVSANAATIGSHTSYRLEAK